MSIYAKRLVNMNWISLHNHSHYSLLDGLSKPINMVKRAKELGYSALALTDHASVSGAVDFMKACKGEIKPILGSELYISELDSTIHDETNGHGKTSHLVVLSKNLAGWKNLIKITSHSNLRENFYYKPRLDLDKLANYTENLIAFSGHPGSALGKCKTKEEAIALAYKYQDIFGKGNFFIEIQRIDVENYPESGLLADMLREVSIFTGIPCVATADSHYVNKIDAIDQWVILCSMLKTTMRNVKTKLENSEEFGLSAFFKSDNYHIPSPEEVAALYTPEELANSIAIADMCENYSILKSPLLPKFQCPGDIPEIEHLRNLAREGWRKKIVGKGLDENVYRDRVLRELKVMEEANLAGYMLIVQDMVKWAKGQGWLVGPGRGSVGGSLIAYLIDITVVDPIKYGLIFERFYNAGRNTKDNISLPDIDVDYPITKRKYMKQYIKDKFGAEKVTEIATFGSLQGRGALKEVLRVHEACSFEMMNQITKCLPQKQEISDQLEESKETSIIRWVLENDPELISEYCRLDDNGNYTGDFGRYFEQAARLEGTYKSQGKHAAGIVISVENVADACPMLFDKKTGEPHAAFEMSSMEAVGLNKFDILGTCVLDKLLCINELLKYGAIQSELNDIDNEIDENEDDE